MGRITHLALLPKNVDFWDYYILCRCDDRVARALQRMEYWDGTKSTGTIHPQHINDQRETIGRKSTQDVSHWVYKTHEELSWELIGSCSERASFEIIDRLVNVFMYLRQRTNPHQRFDHTKQYEFRATLVQSHLDRLYAILDYFFQQGRQQRPVLYAIESLVKQGTYIATMQRGVNDDVLTEDLTAPQLCIDLVEHRLRQMHRDSLLGEKQEASPHTKNKVPVPRFIRSDLKKDERNGFSADTPTPSRFCKIAESRLQNCRMESAKLQSPSCNFAATISVITTETTNNDYQEEASSLSDKAASASAAFFSLLHLFSEKEQHLLLQHLQHLATHRTEIGKNEPFLPVEQFHPSPSFVAPTAPASQERQRSAEAVVQLVEHLRGQPYPSHQRSKELRAAFLLLNLTEAPALSLTEIEEAWRHGSDTYWQENHDGDLVHVHDLVAYNSHGRRRILAFLAHKRLEDRRIASSSRHAYYSEPLAALPSLLPSPSPATLTLVQATALVQDIQAMGATLGYHWHAELQPEGEAWMVIVTWEASTGKSFSQPLRSPDEWEQERPGYVEIIDGYTEFVQARSSSFEERQTGHGTH